MRTRLYADPHGIFLHDAILQACRQFGPKLALVDTSCTPHRRFTYEEYGENVERLARGRSELDDVRAVILRPIDHDPVLARHRHFSLP